MTENKPLFTFFPGAAMPDAFDCFHDDPWKINPFPEACVKIKLAVVGLDLVRCAP